MTLDDPGFVGIGFGDSTNKARVASAAVDRLTVILVVLAATVLAALVVVIAVDPAHVARPPVGGGDVERRKMSDGSQRMVWMAVRRSKQAINQPVAQIEVFDNESRIDELLRTMDHSLHEMTATQTSVPDQHNGLPARPPSRQPNRVWVVAVKLPGVTNQPTEAIHLYGNLEAANVAADELRDDYRLPEVNEHEVIPGDPPKRWEAPPGWVDDNPVQRIRVTAADIAKTKRSVTPTDWNKPPATPEDVDANQRRFDYDDPLSRQAMKARRDRYDQLRAEVARLASTAARNLKRSRTSDGVNLSVLRRAGSQRRKSVMGWQLGTGFLPRPRDSYVDRGGAFGWYVLTDGSVRQVRFTAGAEPGPGGSAMADDDVLTAEYRRERSTRGKPRSTKREAAEITRKLNERTIADLEVVRPLLLAVTE